LGDNARPFYKNVVDYLGRVTGLSTELISGLSPDEQDRMVNSGQIQVVFTCGLPYARKADLKPPLLRLMAAPVMAAPHYKNQPVYFSDIIVRADSPYETFDSLRGSVFAYNEIYSLSGYMLPCYHLLTLSQMGRFFGKMVQSGSHAHSMDWVAQGRADAAAIDSVVLEMELRQHPNRANTFRVIDQIGPQPMPPVAASTQLDDAYRQRLSGALLTMHTDPSAEAIFKQVGMRRFAAVVDSDYDPIRHIIQALQESSIDIF
jgi:phosphonate transport system substrate-binding protein